MTAYSNSCQCVLFLSNWTGAKIRVTNPKFPNPEWSRRTEFQNFVSFYYDYKLLITRNRNRSWLRPHFRRKNNGDPFTCTLHCGVVSSATHHLPGEEG